SFTDGGASITGCAAAAVSGSGNVRTATCITSSLSVGTHSIVATYGGDASNNGSSSAALSQAVTASGSSTTTIWVEDAAPAGATLGSRVDNWTWVSSNPTPYSAALAHQSVIASGTHQHYFYNATATLAVALGDTLFTYVYLDPANPPSELM